MNITQKRVIIYRHLLSSAINNRDSSIKMLKGELPTLVEGEQEAYSILARYLNTQEAIDAFGTAIEIASRAGIEELFRILDDKERIYGEYTFPLALVDWETRENLKPLDDYSYDYGFYCYKYDSDLQYHEFEDKNSSEENKASLILDMSDPAVIMAVKTSENDVLAAILQENNEEKDVLDSFGLDPIHWAVVYGNYEAVRLLIDAGIDVNRVDDTGKPLLNLAVKYSDTRMCKMLIDAGADLNAASSMEGYTPILEASRIKNSELVKLFIDNGADYEATDDNDWVALNHATYNMDAKTLLVLLESGANPNHKSVIGRTPLFYPAGVGWEEGIKILIDYGADVYVEDIAGETAIDGARDPKIKALLKSYKIK